MSYEATDETWGSRKPRAKSNIRDSWKSATRLNPDFLEARKSGGEYSPPDPEMKPPVKFHQNRIDRIKWAVIDDSRCEHPWYNTNAEVIDQILFDQIAKDFEDPNAEGGAGCLVTK